MHKLCCPDDPKIPVIMNDSLWHVRWLLLLDLRKDSSVSLKAMAPLKPPCTVASSRANVQDSEAVQTGDVLHGCSGELRAPTDRCTEPLGASGKADGQVTSCRSTICIHNHLKA